MSWKKVQYENGKYRTVDDSGGGGSGTTFEIVSNTGYYDNNTSIILELTKSYTNPYPIPVNCLPLTNWNNGARVVVQSSTISYNSATDQITFQIYVSSTQNYTCDWMIIDLG